MSRAEQIRKGSTRTITTEDGWEVVIRRPAVIDLVESGLGVVVAQLLPPERQDIIRALDRHYGKRERKKDDQPDLAELHPKLVAFCARVMRDPVLHVGEGPCPDNAVTPEDLGDAVMEIFSLAMEHYGSGVKEAADAAATFRVDGSGEAHQPGGAALRDSPDEAPAPSA